MRYLFILGLISAAVPIVNSAVYLCTRIRTGDSVELMDFFCLAIIFAFSWMVRSSYGAYRVLFP